MFHGNVTWWGSYPSIWGNSLELLHGWFPPLHFLCSFSPELFVIWINRRLLVCLSPLMFMSFYFPKPTCFCKALQAALGCLCLLSVAVSRLPQNFVAWNNHFILPAILRVRSSSAGWCVSGHAASAGAAWMEGPLICWLLLLWHGGPAPPPWYLTLQGLSVAWAFHSVVVSGRSYLLRDWWLPTGKKQKLLGQWGAVPSAGTASLPAHSTARKF